MMNRRGQAVVLAYVALVTITVLGASLLNRAMTSQQLTTIQGLNQDVFYYAEGGLEDAIGRFAQDIANFQVSDTAPRYPVAAGTFLTTTFASGATASSVINEIVPGQTTAPNPDGTSVFLKTYHITTTAVNPTNPAVTVTLHQMFVRRATYTFQDAVFYDGDLEWLPGADMSLSGRVHSNSDTYLAAVSGKLLTVDTDYLHSAGNLYHRRKDDGSVPSGVVQILKAGSSPATYPALTFDSTDPTWATDATATWNGTVQTSVHGVTKQAVPVVGSTAPGGYYDSNAAVKIVNGTLTDGSGNPLTVPPNTIKTTTSFYNNREGKTVKMTEVDLQKLAGYYDANGDGIPDPPGVNGNTYVSRLPSNGLIYATRTDAASSQEPGIRLVNGSQIYRTGGLTVVSNDPIYIQGNYNTTNKQPSAVIGDAVNLLSTNWNDANSTSGLSSRTASPTTVNLAFIAGIDPTVGSQYSGGLENYPRLHENWTGKMLTITGSFVSLWNSQIATGNWVYGGSNYTAPNRVWAWDTSFSSGNNMPPFTPKAIEIVKGAWWKQ